MPITNPGCAPNVSVPQGTIFPDGVDASPANPVVQATVRPQGWFFRHSPGYETIRRGKTQLQHPGGFGIHFAPIQLAENFLTGEGLVDTTDTYTADVADLPMSEDLDADGKLSAADVRANRGIYLADSDGAKTGILPHTERHQMVDMGDRDPGRPISRKTLDNYFRNPVNAFRDDYSENPWSAILVAGAIVGVVYMVSKDFEDAYRRRARGAGAVGAVGAAPAAGVETAGEQVREAASVANSAATAAGEAAKEAAGAAGDAAEAAGKAAEEVADAVADAVTE